jgi:hypothetical protein
MEFSDCPRCGFRSYEKLQTYSYCIDCHYSPVLGHENPIPIIPDWVLKVLNMNAPLLSGFPKKFQFA